MRDIVWSDVLSVGVDEIDDDHHRLVDLFNLLNHSLAAGESAEYLAAVLDELIKCTDWHFSHEERLMLKYGYDAMEEHKAEHRDLIASAKELQRAILEAKDPLADKHVEFLERWLTEHIFTTDMRLGSFLYQAM